MPEQDSREVARRKPEALQLVKPVDRISELVDRLTDLQARDVNLITPLTAVDYIAEMHAVSFRRVDIDHEGREVYRDKHFCEPNERALTKIGLLRIWHAAGGTTLYSRRQDDGRDPHLVDWQVFLELQQLDGRTVQFPGSRTLDYRDGSDQVRGWTEKRLLNARRHIVPLAESFAYERAIRIALAIAPKYTLAELARPFIVPALVVKPDMTDPMVRQLVAMKALNFQTALYGPGRQALPAWAPEAEAAETVPELEARINRETPDSETDDPRAEMEDFETPGPDPAATCACPCGHDREITAEVRTATLERVGAPRCASCFPGRRFDYKAHRDLTTLELPRDPDMTPAKAENWRKRVVEG